MGGEADREQLDPLESYVRDLLQLLAPWTSESSASPTRWTRQRILSAIGLAAVNVALFLVDYVLPIGFDILLFVFWLVFSSMRGSSCGSALFFSLLGVVACGKAVHDVVVGRGLAAVGWGLVGIDVLVASGVGWVDSVGSSGSSSYSEESIRDLIDATDSEASESLGDLSPETWVSYDRIRRANPTDYNTSRRICANVLIIGRAKGVDHGQHLISRVRSAIVPLEPKDPRMLDFMSALLRCGPRP
jgi:hypothetical protein